MGSEFGNPVNHILNGPLIGQSTLDIRTDEVSGQIDVLYRFNVFPNPASSSLYWDDFPSETEEKRALMVLAGIADGEIVSVKNTCGLSDVLQVFQSQKILRPP